MMGGIQTNGNGFVSSGILSQGGSLTNGSATRDFTYNAAPTGGVNLGEGIPVEVIHPDETMLGGVLASGESFSEVIIFMKGGINVAGAATIEVFIKRYLLVPNDAATDYPMQLLYSGSKQTEPATK
jgi:hypothetical protein